jgi:hypothetical protein
MLRITLHPHVSRRIKVTGAVTVAAGLLVAGGFAGPAFAAPAASISAAPSAIQAGETTDITGTGFGASSPYTVTLDPAGSAVVLDLANVTGADGSLTDIVTIPGSVSVGAHVLQVTSTGGAATSNIYVNSTGPVGTAASPSISVTDYSTAGKGQTVVLHGFFPGETVEGFESTDGSGGPTDATTVADSTGTATFTYVSTDAGLGTHYLGGIGDSSTVSVHAQFEVVADPIAPAAPVAPVATPVAANASFTG